MGCESSVEAPAKGQSKPEELPSQAEIPHVFKARYRTGEVLGEGAYSTVKLCANKTTGQQGAVKIVNRQDISKEDELALRQEVEIMQSLDHPNIVRCFDFFEEEKYFYLVLELLEGGELFDRVVKKTVYNEKEARDVIKLVVEAIKYCHDRGVVHRDLKPENLLLKSKEDDSDLKIADFGFAVRTQSGGLSTQCGTPGYIAPEILENKPYGNSVDMWSIGVITYILLGGYPPFHDDNMRNLFKKIRKGEFTFHPEYWGNVSDDAKDLIRGMLTVDVTKRFTADDVLNHAWIKASGSVLAAKSLDSNLAELKKFHAQRKLRSAAKAVIAINRMKALLGSSQDDDLDDDDTRQAERA